MSGGLPSYSAPTAAGEAEGELPCAGRKIRRKMKKRKHTRNVGT